METRPRERRSETRHFSNLAFPGLEDKGGGRRFCIGNKAIRGCREESPPAGSRGGAPLGSLGDEVPQKLKNFKSSYKQILRIFLLVFHTFSPTYAYVFSVLVGIIPLSLRNGGAFDTVCPLVCTWGRQLPPLPSPGSAACAQRASFPWKRTFPGWKDSLIHGDATSESAFGRDNGLTGNTRGLLQN